MSKGIIGGIETAVGALAIVGGAILETIPGGQALGTYLIIAGAGLVLSGVGTILTKGPLQGFATTTRNPIAPWERVFGRARVGGTIVYFAEFGDSNKWLDIVIVLASHPSQSVDALLFDNQRVPIGLHNTSFTPVQQDVPINSPTDITRVGNTVSIKNVQDIPTLEDGDRLLMKAIHPVSLGLNGIFPVFDVIHNSPPGTVQFSYLCGGSAIPPATIDESGRVQTQWQDYKKNVYFESIGDSGSFNRLGHAQSLGETFVGMTAGTPKQGDTGTLVQNDGHGNNPWTADCSLVGMTAVFMRLEFDSQIFTNGIPQISFLLRGKNDILDPRNSPPTRGYTENAALCIADYLADTTVGFKAAYGTEINTPQLIAAANICDERVGLAFPLTSPLTTEPRYTCNGHFNVAMRRGEVLQNLLTSCAGRLTYVGGKFGIWPAAWTGSSLALSDDWVRANAAGGIRWRSSVSISNLYNGVKGTYIAAVNNWQSSDFPRYAQDALHGYNDGPPEFQYDQNLADDGGDRRWLDIQLPFTISCPTAQRLAKIELMRRRQQGTGTFVLNMAGYQIAPLDLIAMSLTYFGWTGKYLEVLATRFKIDRQSSGEGEVTLIGTEIDVQETDPSVYDWEIIEELSPQGYQHPGVPNSVFTPDPPSNLAIVFDDAGNTVLTWTAPLDAYVTTIEGRYQLLQSPEGIWISLGTFDASVTQHTLPSLLAGSNYIIQLRSVNGAGIPSGWVSINYTPLSLPPQWAPYQVQASPADALFPNEYNFDVATTYADLTGGQGVMADGTAFPRIKVVGAEPVNSVLDCAAPIITAVRVNSTGGHIKGGIVLYLTVTADGYVGTWDEHAELWADSAAPWDSGRTASFSPPAAVFPITIPAGTDTNSLDIDVTWPTADGLTSFTVYASDQVDLICAQEWHGVLTLASPPDGTYGPATVTLGGATSPPGSGLLRSTWEPPNPNLRKIRLKATVGYHLGVLGAGIDSISGNEIISAGAIDPDLRDNWTGRAIAIIGRNNTTNPVSSIPFWSRLCIAFDPSIGKFTFANSVQSSPPLESEPRVGDALVVCTLGYDNSASPYEVTDPGWVNSWNYDFNTFVRTPFSGLSPNLERGMILRVIKGTGRRSKANVLANTGATHFLDAPVILGPDSVWVITERGWPYQQDSIPIDNPDPFQALSMQLPLDNFYRQSFVVFGFQVDLEAAESEEMDAPMRMVFIWGDPGTVASSEVVISYA